MPRLTIEEKIEEELANAVEQMMANGKYAALDKKDKTTDKNESVDKDAEKHSDNKRFVIFLLIYSTILIIAICAGLYYVWGVLVDYDAGLPDAAMEALFGELKSELTGSVLDDYEFTVSEFDTLEAIKDIYKDYADTELSYAKASTYKSDAPVYKVMADDLCLAYVSLISNSVNGHGFSMWEPGDISFNEELIDYETVSIKVPKGVSVYINDILVSDTYAASTEKVPITDNIADYVSDIPEYIIYNIDGVLKGCSISADDNGMNIVKTDEEGFTAAYTYATDDSMYAAIADRALAIAHSYAMYLIKSGDLSGAQSYTVGTARKYLSSLGTNIFYLWNEEFTYDFTDEQVGNIVKYNDECLSCDVDFTLNVHYRTSQTITYKTRIQGMYVNINNGWYLADFMLDNTESDESD